MGTTLFQGHKMEKAPLLKSMNSEGLKQEHLKEFRRERLIKVSPLQVHLETLRQYFNTKEMTQEDYKQILEINTYGRDLKEIVSDIKSRFRNNHTLVKQIKESFEKGKGLQDKVESENNDYIYPSAIGGAVPQWKLKGHVPARCVCRMTNYLEDVYRKVL